MTYKEVLCKQADLTYVDKDSWLPLIIKGLKGRQVPRYPASIPIQLRTKKGTAPLTGTITSMPNLNYRLKQMLDFLQIPQQYRALYTKQFKQNAAKAKAARIAHVGGASDPFDRASDPVQEVPIALHVPSVQGKTPAVQKLDFEGGDEGSPYRHKTVSYSVTLPAATKKNPTRIRSHSYPDANYDITQLDPKDDPSMLLKYWHWANPVAIPERDKSSSVRFYKPDALLKLSRLLGFVPRHMYLANLELFARMLASVKGMHFASSMLNNKGKAKYGTARLAMDWMYGLTDKDIAHLPKTMQGLIKRTQPLIKEMYNYRDKVWLPSHFREQVQFPLFDNIFSFNKNKDWTQDPRSKPYLDTWWKAMETNWDQIVAKNRQQHNGVII